MALNTFSSLQAMDVNISKMKELCKCAQVSFKNYVVPINLNLYNSFWENSFSHTTNSTDKAWMNNNNCSVSLRDEYGELTINYDSDEESIITHNSTNTIENKIENKDYHIEMVVRKIIYADELDIVEPTNSDLYYSEVSQDYSEVSQDSDNFELNSETTSLINRNTYTFSDS
tara:strand:+ start:490 stop:1005 length:516 start_codon:yes stop_codon:yes gene_type:complete